MSFTLLCRVSELYLGRKAAAQFLQSLQTTTTVSKGHFGESTFRIRSSSDFTISGSSAILTISKRSIPFLLKQDFLGVQRVTEPFEQSKATCTKHRTGTRHCPEILFALQDQEQDGCRAQVKWQLVLCCCREGYQKGCLPCRPACLHLHFGCSLPWLPNPGDSHQLSLLPSMGAPVPSTQMPAKVHPQTSLKTDSTPKYPNTQSQQFCTALMLQKTL